MHALHFRRHFILKGSAPQPVEEETGVEKWLRVQDGESRADDSGRIKVAVNNGNVPEVRPNGGVDDRTGLDELARPGWRCVGIENLNVRCNDATHIVDGADIHVAEPLVGLLLSARLSDPIQLYPTPAAGNFKE